MSRYIYIRGLRQVDHSVFCVENGQKTYFNAQFNRSVPYSSGQQVKRSLLDALVESIPGEKRAPITFNYEITKGKKGEDALSQKEPWSPCDPAYADQLIGGWMRAQSNSMTIKRRSPMSISAMRALHPTLANTNGESLTFDRSENPSHHPVRVRDSNGNELSIEEVNEFLQSNERSLPRRHWIPRDKVGKRAEGLFVFDLAIDLERLFTVSTNQHDPELGLEKIESLKEDGWIEHDEMLIAPPENRKSLIPALASAIINWRITSNQSRTFSPQATLALAISDNANRIVNAIRADLREEEPKADPVIQHVEGVDLFISLAAQGYIPGIVGDAEALTLAQKQIENLLREGSKWLEEIS